MCGDPPNIIIGTSLIIHFQTYQNTGVMVGICGFTYIFFAYRKELSTTESVDTSFPQPKSTDKKALLLVQLFLAAVILLITHSMTGFTVPAIGFYCNCNFDYFNKHIPEIISKVDHKTLFILVGLFVVIGGLSRQEFLK